MRSIRSPRQFLGRVLVLGILSVAAACGQAGGDDDDTTPVGPVSSIRITPDSLSLAIGATGQLDAQALDSAGRVVRGATFKWRSDPGVLVDSLSGAVKAVSVARAIVVAESDGVRGYALVKSPGPLAQIWASAAVDSMLPGQALSFTLLFRDSEGNPLDPSPVVWSVDEPALATISASGVLTGAWPGLVHVKATADTIVGYATARVLVPVATVELEPAALTLGTRSTYRSTVTLRDSAGGIITGRPLTWMTTGSASLLQDNVIAASNTPGTGSVIVRVEGRADTTNLEVRRFAFTAIGSGSSHVCGVTSESSIACWGWNEMGQLGVTDVGRVTGPALLPGNQAWRAVSGGSQYTCALTIAGQAWCWGSNEYGQLGDGTLTSSTTPVPVTGGYAFQSIATGNEHACGITTTGETRCWGRNRTGELGAGTFGGYSAEPLLVLGAHEFASITTGYETSCGVESDGTGWCWGHGLDGTLGNGINWFDHAEPTAVAGGLQFIAVVPGMNMGCGAATDGKGYCWGGGTPDVPTQLQLYTVPWVQIDLGLSHACAINSNTDLYCWGFNVSGQAGTDPWVPVISAATSVTLGNQHSCALSAGKVYCWGSNEAAQLGVGALTLTDGKSLTPKLVVGQ